MWKVSVPRVHATPRVATAMAVQQKVRVLGNEHRRVLLVRVRRQGGVLSLLPDHRRRRIAGRRRQPVRMLQRAALLPTVDMYGRRVGDVSAVSLALLAVALRPLCLHVMLQQMQSAWLPLSRQTTGLATAAA